ncbi:Nif3-like dinuclear metal center hexameric protein [Lachnoclostridium sp. MSJ-17]|uniref:Nif3-like dinuclear metal center hexameric protein n=1 Tax=Lachnoclostridium sp. MSJ-17 TaxID=2841516 RepID=UPI001C10717A|nr:Nif3-like dinuclear metal center hexameric protein [Lachnoclostridium sp. MSJ-17]MBU5462285.1 Nif3-like dinuclear metal center hexameric protein [Lachnoclostridium sp. MSJ-17]
MTTIKDIIDYFESFAPLNTAMDFDNCGLLVGDARLCVKKVLLTLDITAGVVDEAAELGCGLIISHHPVIFQPIKRLGTQAVTYLLAQKGIAALCMHTNLDLSESFGVNICLGQAAGLSDVKRAGCGDALFYGTLNEEITAHELARRIKDSLGCEGLRYSEGRDKIRTVAVSSGAGGSDIFAAAEIGADALVTGEIKHHEINAANALGIAVIDAGHFKSEDIVINPLKDRLSEKFPETEFTKSQTYSDKVKYLI